MGGEPEGRGLVITKIPKALDGSHWLPSKNDDSEEEVTGRASGAAGMPGRLGAGRVLS